MSTVHQEFTYGDVVPLRGNGSLVVTSPSGIVSCFPASVHRVQRFRVEELGTWSYVWDDGINGEFIVVPTPTQLASVIQLEHPKSPEKVTQESSRVLPMQAGEKFFAFF